MNFWLLSALLLFPFVCFGLLNRAMSSIYTVSHSQSKCAGKRSHGIPRQYPMVPSKGDPTFILKRKYTSSTYGSFVHQTNEAKHNFESYDAQNHISLHNGIEHKILSPWQLLKDDCVSNENSKGGNNPFVGFKLKNKYDGGWEKEDRQLCYNGIRLRVKDTLKLFRQELRKFQQENKYKPRLEKGNSYTIASNVLKNNGRWLNTDKCLGSVLGVEIGDEFQSKMELRIVGLHHRQFCGIDYLEQDGVKLAASVVATGRYANKMEGSDVLVYIGEGGNPQVQSPLKDQKLERGNLALKNSIEHRTPVRVIRHKRGQQQNAAKLVYVYEGLHLVETYRQYREISGKLVFKFFLRKAYDIVLPIKYNLEQVMKLSLSYNKSTSNDGYDYGCDYGCACSDGCPNNENCLCTIKNEGKRPYDGDRCLVKKLPMVYECGPLCKCSLSCMNRVSQRGTKAKLELFKNKNSRYSIRSKSYIMKGSFICKYIPRKEFLGKEIPREISNIRMDVSEDGDVGKFIDNSGSPSLYGQEVKIGDEDESHLMLFAMRNITPGEELTIGHKNQILNT